MEELIDSGSGNSSPNGDNPLRNSPFGALSVVLSDEDLSNIFSGLGNGEGSGSPFDVSGNNGTDLPDPFADENFWDIFAGGVNPSAAADISATEIPDGLALRVTIDNLINSRLNELPDNIQIPSFDPGEIPSFGGGEIPSFGSGEIPSFGDGEIPSFGGGEIPSFGGGEIPSFGGGQIPSFGGGQNPFA